MTEAGWERVLARLVDLTPSLGGQLSVVSYQWSVFSGQFSVVSFQF